MSSSTSAVLYAVTISSSPAGAVPDDASKKAHHLKGGFRNPWE